MNRITDVTRQDIFDVIRNGFIETIETTAYEPHYDKYMPSFEDVQIFMPFYGRLTEIDFLSRIYDLDNLPSTDSRFSNASGDIWQHTINNDDWDDYWFFYDDRFHLSNGNDDQYILRFICEMLHPAVRKEQSNWRKYLEKFNELLEPDGYELYVCKKMSGRDVFSFRRTNYIEISHAGTECIADLVYIGSGSYADVYKYWDDYYNRTFALKRAKENIGRKALLRFKKEFEEMAKLNSQYVVEVYSYNDEKNEYIMEYMDTTLEDYINQHYQSLNKTQKAIICSKILKAFSELHKNKVLHRDISPQNILIKHYMEGLVFKIADFGFVKTEESNLTTTNTALRGSLNDPSLAITGFKNYSIEHEIYALTRLMVYILTGSTDHSSISDKHINELLKTGTNPHVKKRYKNISELKDAVIVCIKSME